MVTTYDPSIAREGEYVEEEENWNIYLQEIIFLELYLIMRYLLFQHVNGRKKNS